MLLRFYFNSFRLLFITAFQYAHLMNGDLVEFDETPSLLYALFDKDSIKIFHIGKAY